MSGTTELRPVEAAPAPVMARLAALPAQIEALALRVDQAEASLQAAQDNHADALYGMNAALKAKEATIRLSEAGELEGCTNEKQRDAKVSELLSPLREEVRAVEVAFRVEARQMEQALAAAKRAYTRARDEFRAADRIATLLARG